MAILETATLCDNCTEKHPIESIIEDPSGLCEECKALYDAMSAF